MARPEGKRRKKGDSTAPRVVVWERDDATRELLRGYGKENGWELTVVTGHEELMAEVKNRRPDLLFVELPNLYFATEESLSSFASDHVDIATVAILDGSRCNRVAHLLDEGIADCLIRPVDAQSLQASTARALRLRDRRVREMKSRRALVHRTMARLGIETPYNGHDRTRVLPRFWIILSVTVLAILGAGFGFLEYSTSPRFCNSCHIMEPYVKAWKESTHSDIGCVECHYPPNEYWKTKFQAISQVSAWITGTYSTKPYAEIDDENCLACHTTRLLQGEVVFKRGIKFDHVPHLEKLRRGKKLKCTTCHSQIVQGEHVAVNERVCFICHFMGKVQGIEPQTQEFCTECHMPPEEDIELAGITYNHKDFVGNGVECQRCHLEAVKGDGAVAKHMCYTCHGEPERLARYGDDEFLHQKHVTEHKVECDQCHSEIVHKVKTNTSPLDYDCRTCHTASHLGIKKMYMGTGGKQVDDQPNPMFLAQVDCIGCHVEGSPPLDDVASFGEKTLRGAEAGCLNCHGSDYEGLLEMWLDDVQADLEKTGRYVDALDAALSSTAEGEKNEKAAKQLEAANYNYHFVKTFHGVHNPDYAAELLKQARKDAEEGLKILGAPLPEEDQEPQ